MRDAVLQHLLYPRHQKDIRMGVGHGKDTLRGRKDGGKDRINSNLVTITCVSETGQISLSIGNMGRMLNQETRK